MTIHRTITSLFGMPTTQELVQRWDPSLYSRAPLLNIASAITLGQALIHYCPKDAEPQVKDALKGLKGATNSAQSAWASRQAQGAQAALSPADRRAVDSVGDRSWGAFHDILEAKASLPADLYPQASRAQRLLTLLFSDGLRFLTWRYSEQLAAMDTLLLRIEKEGLQADIDLICGKELLPLLQSVQVRYRAMVRGQEALPELPEASLREYVQAIADAVVDYALAICSTVNRRSQESIVRAKQALAPIDQARDQARDQAQRPPQDPAEPSDPAEPAPAPPSPAAPPTP